MRIKLIAISIVSACWFGSCADRAGEQIITVCGPIKTSEMGITLPHEHILVDFIGADSTGPHRWDRQEVARRALPFLQEVYASGCRTFVDCTPPFLGRDPELLRMLSEETGLNILTNTGLYGAGNNKHIPSRAFEMSAEELAGEWIAEFRQGIGGTGIRPGFIKIAVDPDDTLSPMQEKIVRAAALTHLETGLVINSHTGPDIPAFNQLEVLREINVPADAFIWTHAQWGSPDGWKKAAGRGAWISFDNIRSDNIETYLSHLQEMKSAGLLEHVLISHDSGWYTAGEENGGDYRGYAAIFKEFIPALKNAGFTEEEIDWLCVENPARAYRIRQNL